MENGAMLDILMLAIGLGFFALLTLYGIAGERLWGDSDDPRLRAGRFRGRAHPCLSRLRAAAPRKVL